MVCAWQHVHAAPCAMAAWAAHFKTQLVQHAHLGDCPQQAHGTMRTCRECRAELHLSASSSRTILCRPGGNVTFFCANILMRLRTTSMPLSSDALSSSTASFMAAGPNKPRAMARMLVVLPVPGGPDRIRFGILPCSEMTCSRDIASTLPTISDTFCGLYFSSCTPMNHVSTTSTHMPCIAPMLQRYRFHVIHMIERMMLCCKVLSLIPQADCKGSANGCKETD